MNSGALKKLPSYLKVLEFILAKPTTGEYNDKGSSFHAVSEPVLSADHLKSILLTLKKQFPDANHICYAYRIKKGKSLDEFSSDAGEPKGSAGLRRTSSGLRGPCSHRRR